MEKRELHLMPHHSPSARFMQCSVISLPVIEDYFGGLNRRLMRL